MPYQPDRWRLSGTVTLLWFVVRWFLICLPVSAMIGSAVALFLWSLDQVTELRWQNPWLLYGLPVAGLVSGLMYQYFGREAEAGNNLIIEQIHEPGGGVPARMAPMVLVGTLMTHLFGGSAGREGTAVQMGGSLASGAGRLLRMNADDTRILLSCGVSAGFGAVFGTPVTGALFALEVLSAGLLNYQRLIPCLMASVLADQITTLWGIGHTPYQILYFSELTSRGSLHTLPDPVLAIKVAAAAVCFGMGSVLFVEVIHACYAVFRRLIHRAWARPVAGGVLVIVMVQAIGNRDYLGLGVATGPVTASCVTITSCFAAGGASMFSWWWKILFTSVTVGSGFKGGEVTPLFFIGAAMGNTLAVILGAPVDLMAGLGFVALFSGATNTPLACTVMAVELFTPHSPGLMRSGFLVYAAMACFLSYFVSGSRTIYTAQRNEASCV